MRLLAALSAASLLALAACDGEPDGKGLGASCASAGECRAGLVCLERTCATDYLASPACTTPGAPVIAAGDPVQLPETPADLCLTTVREPAPPEGFLDLGVVEVGQRLSFEVPAGTASFTIFSQEVDGPAVPSLTYQGTLLPNTVVPTDVRLPDGELFFSDTAPYPVDAAGYDDVTGVLAYYGGFTPTAGAFTIPNTAASLDLVRTAGEMPPGTWTFTVNDWAEECRSIPGCTTEGTEPRLYRMHAFARPGPLASTGTLDLEVYLATDPGGPLPDAAAASAHPQIARFVRGLSHYLGAAGICLGAVTFRDIPPWARARYAPEGIVDVTSAGAPPFGCDDLSQLFTVAMAPTRAVHLFLADELLDGSAGAFGTTLGIDGSIPGPSGIPGTITSGAIVGVAGFFALEVPGSGACAAAGAPSFDCGTDVLAYIAAHEAGHWLGLYHTTEWYGATFDPLSDTGTCACAACAPEVDRRFCAENGGGSPAPVDASSCRAPEGGLAGIAARALPGAGCGGGRNLMFWQFDPALSLGNLSRQQGEVMRFNPAVR